MTPHPTLEPLCEALSVLWGHQGTADQYAVPPFVWGHAAVGAKDVAPGGLRYAMPLMTDGPLLTDSDALVRRTARLGDTSVEVTLAPVPAHTGSVEDARLLVWKQIEKTITALTYDTVDALMVEWRALPANPQVGADPSAVADLADLVSIGNDEHPGLLAPTLQALCAPLDDLSRVDVLRWLQMRLRWRVSYRVRAILGDPRCGTQVRAMVADGQLPPYTQPTIDAAMSLDMMPLVAPVSLTAGDDEWIHAHTSEAAEVTVLRRAV